MLWNIDTRIRDVNSAPSFVQTENKVESHHGGVHYKGTMRTGHCERTAVRGKKEKQNGMQHADNGALRLT